MEEDFDVLFLDETIYTISAGLLDEKLVLDFLKKKPDKLEVILTGNTPSEAMIAADCFRLLPLALQTLYHLFDFFVVKVFFVRYNLLGKCRSLIYTGGSLK